MLGPDDVGKAIQLLLPAEPVKPMGWIHASPELSDRYKSPARRPERANPVARMAFTITLA